MDRNKLFKIVVYLALSLYILDSLAQKFYWYYSIYWFDMLAHFLGGFLVAVFFLWYFSIVHLPFLRRPILDLNKQTLWQALLFVLFIGLCWEAGEFLTSNFIGLEPWSALDTASDIFFDLAGGTVAMFYVFWKIMPSRLNKVEWK